MKMGISFSTSSLCMTIVLILLASYTLRYIMQNVFGKSKLPENSQSINQIQQSVVHKQEIPLQAIDLPDFKLNKHSLSINKIDQNVALAKQSQTTTVNADLFQKFTNFNISLANANQFFKPYQSGSFVLVDTLPKLRSAAEFLSKQTVVAIDLENFSDHSYDGFTCLVQISANFGQETPIKTYIIDVLQSEIKDNFKDVLGTSTLENSEILKILHGAQSTDVVWLQRDFGVQLCSMYDTQEFQRSFLSDRKIALYNLLEEYCPGMYLYTGDQKKEFQLCDWSARPLSLAQLDYAGQDTYYLHQIAVLQQQKCFTQPIRQKGKGKQTTQCDAENIKQEFLVHFDKLQRKVQKATYQSARYAFDPMETYRKGFKKTMDMYDPSSDEYLASELVFRDLFNLREQIAQRIDCDPQKIANLSDQDLLATARLAVKKNVLKQNEELLHTEVNQYCQGPYQKLFQDQTDKSIKAFDIEKDSLLQRYSSNSSNTKASASDIRQLGKSSQMIRQEKKLIRKQDIIKKYTCKKAVYENGKMLAPDGQLLSYLDHKKATWYVERGLATIVQDDPITIKLTFEPNGRDSNNAMENLKDDDFYTAEQKNLCVVCGTTSNYSRFHVVPSLYRVHFPDSLKSHRSHDVVLLCFECHNEASRRQDKVKRQFEVKYNVPHNQLSEMTRLNQQIKELKKGASSLVKGQNQIPAEKKQPLILHVCSMMLCKEWKQLLIDEAKIPIEYFYIAEEIEKNSQIHQEEKALKLVTYLAKELVPLKLTNQQKLNPHGKLIVDKVIEEYNANNPIDEQEQEESEVNQNFKLKGLSEFIQVWRQNFLENDPKFLPSGWRIDHKTVRNFGEHSKFSSTSTDAKNE